MVTLLLTHLERHSYEGMQSGMKETWLRSMISGLFGGKRQRVAILRLLS